MQALEKDIEELSYESYRDHQYYEISFDGLASRASQLGIGNRARWESGRWIPQPYPGFALQAMAQASSNCEALAIDLQSIQHQILPLLEPADLYPLPPASFHQTIANTFSSERLQRHVIDAGLYKDFPALVASATDAWQDSSGSRPPTMRLIGVGLFRTAIGLLGVFEKQADFARVVAFRDHFYSSPELTEIGLRRTRPFIGHVTLAYFESILSEDKRHLLVDGISGINTQLRQRPLLMELTQAELHRYDDLSAFIPDPAYPRAKL